MKKDEWKSMYDSEPYRSLVYLGSIDDLEFLKTWNFGVQFLFQEGSSNKYGIWNKAWWSMHWIPVHPGGTKMCLLISPLCRPLRPSLTTPRAFRRYKECTNKVNASEKSGSKPGAKHPPYRKSWEIKHKGRQRKYSSHGF